MSKTVDDRAELLLRCMAYEPETGAFTYLVNSGNRSAGDVASSVCRLGYARFKIGGHTIAGHRAAFVFMLGRWPTHFVDHINGVRSDNRWVNLREATPAGNSQNRPVQWNSTSGIRGVRCRPGQSKTKPWEARIKVGGRFIHLGSFATQEEAVAARAAASKRYHQDFAGQLVRGGDRVI